ncbi:MAG TPA: hypothetical protein ENI54_04265 [bacterium]|nr:hypothetical protein [bacterium]
MSEYSISIGRIKKQKGKPIIFTLIFLATVFIILPVLFVLPSAYGKGSTLKIAVVIPTRGRFVYFSKQFINGLLLSLDDKGGSKINYVTVNLPVNAGATDINYIFTSLSKKGVSAVIGPLFATQLKYFASNSAKFKIPVITPSPFVAKKDASSFTFSYGMTLKQEIRTEIEYAASNGISRISVIYPHNGYGPKLMDYIRHFSSKNGIDIINSTEYDDKTVDFFYNFHSIVKFNKLKKGRLSKAEEAQLGVTPFDLMHGITKVKPHIPFKGLFVIGNPSKLGLILTQLMYYNITGFPIFGLSPFDSEHFIEKYGFYMQNAIFTDGFFKYDNDKVVKKFASIYQNNYGKMPNIISAEGYDIGGILIKAAEAFSHREAVGPSGSSNNPPPFKVQYLMKANNARTYTFYDAILSVKSFRGVCGISRLSGNKFKKGLYLFKYRDNKIYVLKSPF